MEPFFSFPRMMTLKPEKNRQKYRRSHRKGNKQMKVVVLRSSGFLSSILRLIFGIHKEQE